MGKEILRTNHLCKEFPGAKALDNICLSFQEGTIHVIVGENGAGKSTLLKAIAGVIKKDSGEIYIDGIPVEINDVKHAEDLGFSMIFQEPELVPDLSVVENLYLGKELKARKWLGFMNENKMLENTKNAFCKLGININPFEKAKNLGFAQKQFIQLARSYLSNPRIILVDEISDALTDIETEKVFSILKEMRDEGKTVIYLTYKILEAKKIGDFVTILKDGREVLTERVEHIIPDSMLQLMLGRDLKERYPKLPVNVGEEVFKVIDLNGIAIKDINFTLYQGEILGIAGLVGSGRTNLARTIIGLDHKKSGRVSIDQKAIDIESPLDAISHGIGFISENKNEQGLLMLRNVAENITISNTNIITSYMMISDNKEIQIAQDLVKRLGIKTRDIKQKVSDLSIGNRQKTLIARCLLSNSKVFIFDEPTMGVDTAGKIEIYNIMNELVRRGGSIILISSDFSELVGMCNRILIVHKGAIIKEIMRDEATNAKLFYYACGGNDAS